MFESDKVELRAKLLETRAPSTVADQRVAQTFDDLVQLRNALTNNVTLPGSGLRTMTAEEARGVLGGYFTEMPTNDTWGTPYRIVTAPSPNGGSDCVVVISAGADRTFDTTVDPCALFGVSQHGKATADLNADIIVTWPARFAQYPKVALEQGWIKWNQIQGN